LFVSAQQMLELRNGRKPNARHAKNVILFVGDGMDPTTVAASRIFDGQSRGEEGEENFLAFEKFPNLAMSKTYTTDSQVPDSAGTMSAMMTGVKTRSGVIAVTRDVAFGDCAASLKGQAMTIGELAEMKGLSTGVVTTARLTHATPAAVYAHAPDRNWEADALVPEGARKSGCKDIARQLVEFPYGDGVDVALGGGRSMFLPPSFADPEYPGSKGVRSDTRNLTAEWKAKGPRNAFVYDAKGLAALDPKATGRVLGLFEPSHMKYEADRPKDAAGEPSLEEMTKKAIELLSRDRDGFFLMVEAGRIDHAHHEGNAARALRDTQALSEAVAAARAMTSTKDTLIVVTADHGHTLVFQGYPKKGNPILGLATATIEDEASPDGYALAADGKPYTTLGYANGPGSALAPGKNAKVRPAPAAAEAADIDYKQQSLVPFAYETHGGQDVAIYASGPDAYLFSGVVEQNYIYHVIDAALGLRAKKK
jgi:alkaline phosphatase